MISAYQGRSHTYSDIRLSRYMSHKSAGHGRNYTCWCENVICRSTSLMVCLQRIRSAAAMWMFITSISSCDVERYIHQLVSPSTDQPVRCITHTEPEYRGHINCANYCRRLHCYMFAVDTSSCTICQYNNNVAPLNIPSSSLIFIRGKQSPSEYW